MFSQSSRPTDQRLRRSRQPLHPATQSPSGSLPARRWLTLSAGDVDVGGQWRPRLPALCADKGATAVRAAHAQHVQVNLEERVHAQWMVYRSGTSMSDEHRGPLVLMTCALQPFLPYALAHSERTGAIPNRRPKGTASYPIHDSGCEGHDMCASKAPTWSSAAYTPVMNAPSPAQPRSLVRRPLPPAPAAGSALTRNTMPAGGGTTTAAQEAGQDDTGGTGYRWVVTPGTRCRVHQTAHGIRCPRPSLQGLYTAKHAGCRPLLLPRTLTSRSAASGWRECFRPCVRGTAARACMAMNRGDRANVGHSRRRGSWGRPTHGSARPTWSQSNP